MSRSRAASCSAANGEKLYAGGRFTTAGGIRATNIAVWDGSSWDPLGAGIRDHDIAGGGGGIVRALVADGNDLIAGGTFRLAGAIGAVNVARWDGSQWNVLSNGIHASGTVYALHRVGTFLYAGGFFSSAGTGPADSIAMWDGTNWSSLGSGVTFDGSAGVVNALLSDGTELIVGGGCTAAGNKPANNIALWRIPHSLNIQRAGNEVTLSWPVTGTNFLLETCLEIGPTAWQAVPDEVTIVNNQCIVTNTLGPSHQFYRLRRK